MTLTELARLLMVTTNQVWTWYSRRSRNGFPEAVGCVWKPIKGGRKGAPIFNVREVVEWYAHYDPYANHGVHWARKRAQASRIAS